MKLLTFITALTLIFSSQSFAKSVVGVSLFCKGNTKESYSHIGIYFSNETRFQELFFNGDKIEIVFKEYRLNGVDKINLFRFYTDYHGAELNRKTLKIKNDFVDYNCTVMKSYQEILDNMRIKLQEMLEENQI